ncbi:MAG TPA: hypothetical protein VGE74_20385 [Gemmata sp.]
MGCPAPFGGAPNFDPYGLGNGGALPQPYYAPQPIVRQPQPKPVAVRPQPKPVEAPKPVRAVVPPPDQLGIALEDPPVVVPTPKELGIDLD